MENGQIPFDMTFQDRVSGSIDYCILKRWKKYTIYSKSGSWNRNNYQDVSSDGIAYTRFDGPQNNFYTTNSIYLYDYITVTKTWYDSLIYTASVIDSNPGDPNSQLPGQLLWQHNQNTFKNSPNLTTNNYIIPILVINPGNIITYGSPTATDNGEYFELVNGYPRNHHIHKRDLFSLYTLRTHGIQNGNETSGSYKRCQETINTTIGEDGLEDGTSPVQSFTVGNMNLVQTTNVINS